MTILAPISGDADACLVLAGALTGSATRFAAAAADLSGLSAGAVWEGPAGEAFARRIGGVRPVLEAAADRYAGCAAALRAFAPVLADTQARATAAVEEQADAVRRYAVLEDEIWRQLSAGATELDPTVVVLRASQHGCLVRQRDAEDAHARALAEFDAADRACALALARASDDVLADSATYRAVHSASSRSFASDLLSVPGVILPPLGAAHAVVSTAADGLLRAFWNEGGWDQVAVNAAIAGLGSWGRVLKRASGLGAVEQVTTTGGRTVRTVRVTETWTTGARLREGVRAEGRAKARAWVQKATGQTGPPIFGLPDTPTPSRMSGQAPSPSLPWRDRLRAVPPRVGRTLEEQVSAKTLGWRLASANGPQAQRMYVEGVTLEQAAKRLPAVIEGQSNQDTYP